MMRRWFILVLVLVVSVTAAAQTPDQATVVQGNNAFAFDLYQLARAEDGNLIFSPYSISQALAMTYAGANGKTAAEMSQALHFTLPNEALHPAFQALNTDLNTPPAYLANDTNLFQFNIANALWGQMGFGFNSAYLDTVNVNYGGGFREVDFAADPNAARDTINQWVAEETEDKIQNLIPELDPLTRLILTNAIYFKASWQDQFEPTATQDGDFTLLDGSAVTAPLMTLTESYLYTEGANYQALAMPYAGDDKAMLIILPRAGEFEAVESTLTNDVYNAILLTADYQEAWVTLPRFTAEYSTSLVEALSQLGMAQAFTPEADFSTMLAADNDQDLFIGDVIHKAFIAVDENGTEAAAATAVIMETTSMPMPSEPVEFRADRPFIYLIYDQNTSSILFMGRVLNPAG